MFRPTLLLPLILASAALLSACDDNGKSILQDPNANSGGNNGGGSAGIVQGRVFDTESGASIAGATVRIGALQATSDPQGNFNLPNVPANERAMLTVSLAGYETAYRVVPVAAGETAFVSVQSLPVGASESVDPAVGGDVELPGSPGLVRFGAGAINASGPVVVSITDVNPGASAANMPGDYTATSSAGDPSMIESFGALAINIRTVAGADVDLASGRTATLRIPLSTRSSARPASIPLFFFDETLGRWVEQGTATLRTDATGTYYEGEVSHFTYWNADLRAETVRITGCVADADNRPVAGARVNSNGINYSGTSSAFTNAQGRFSIPVRASSSLTLTGMRGTRVTSSREVLSGATTSDISPCLLFGDDRARSFSIRLSWGQTPSDLDSWLLLPEGGFISYTNDGSLTTPPFAALDVDDTSSFGPEVITVLRPRVGTYRYFVNNFSRLASGITPSPTRVELTVGGSTQPFVPPAGETASTFNWTVFDLVVSADCSVRMVAPQTPWTVEQPQRPAQPNETAAFCQAPN